MELPLGQLYADFEEVQALTDPELETLLRAGDGPERIWAAWSLSLRHGPSAVPALSAAAGSAPDAGVRGTLAVVLAGFGQRETLAVFATDDPDAEVRAVACTHLARTSLPELPWVRDLLETRLRIDKAGPVQAALLDQVIAGQISIDSDMLRSALRSAEWRIRKRAVDHLLGTWARHGRMPPGVLEVIGDDDLAIRANVRDAAVDRLGAEGFVAMLGGMRTLPTDIIRWHLDDLMRAGTRVGWSSIAELADRPELEDQLVVILESGDVGSRAWLLRLDASHSGYTPWGTQEKLRAVIEESPTMSPEEVAVAAQIRDRVERSIADPIDPEEEMDAWDIEELEEWLATMRDYRDALDRAIRAAGGSNDGAHGSI